MLSDIAALGIDLHNIFGIKRVMGIKPIQIVLAIMSLFFSNSDVFTISMLVACRKHDNAFIYRIISCEVRAARCLTQHCKGASYLHRTYFNQKLYVSFL